MARGAKSPVHLSGFRSGTSGMTADRLGGISDGTDGAMLLMWELGSGYTRAELGRSHFVAVGYRSSGKVREVTGRRLALTPSGEDKVNLG